MFKQLRVLSGTVEGLAATMKHISEVLPKLLESWDRVGPLQERLTELERVRHQWEADMDAQMTRADSRFKAARSAEERTRIMADNAQAPDDGAEGEEDLRAQYLELLRRNGEAGGDEAVHQVSDRVAIDPKTRALQAKFGTGG